MPRNTNQGKAFSLDELLNLARIDTFGGPYKGAIVGALTEAKRMRIENDKLIEEVRRLQSLLQEKLAEDYRRDRETNVKELENLETNSSPKKARRG